MNKFKIAIISDSHLIKNSPFLGINTFKSFKAIIDNLVNNLDNYELVLFLGDMVQDQKMKSFEFLNEQLARINIKKFLIRGNHDIKGILPINDFVEHNHPFNFQNWILTPIESYKKGEIYGEISIDKINKIKKILNQKPQSFGIIYLHHNLFETFSPWLDIHITKNFIQIREELSKIQNLKLVVCGHIHQYTKNIIGDKVFLSTPSTSAQFKHSTEKFTLDTIGPGYLDLELNEDGTHKVNVIRISGNFGEPEKNPKTY